MQIAKNMTSFISHQGNASFNQNEIYKYIHTPSRELLKIYVKQKMLVRI